MNNLHKIWWLWVPLAMLAGQIALEVFVPTGFQAALHSEGGPHETLQFIFAALGLIVAFRCLFSVSVKQQPFLFFWLTCFCLGCAYIAGEEISWGQHVFEWGTPDFWSGVNDQNETNLHNTSSWLDQKPRLILLIGVIVGGLIIPALRRFKSEILPKTFEAIYPPAILVPTAALAVLIKITDKIDEELADITILSRASEVEELYLFYFVLLYLLILRGRILQQ